MHPAPLSTIDTRRLTAALLEVEGFRQEPVGWLSVHSSVQIEGKSDAAKGKVLHEDSCVLVHAVDAAPGGGIKCRRVKNGV